MPKGEHFKGKRPEGAGRKVGSENRIKGDLRLKLAKAYEGMTDEILDLAADPCTPAAIRVDIWKTLGKKVVPDLSATTLNPDSSGQGQHINIIVNPPSHDSNGQPLT